MATEYKVKIKYDASGNVSGGIGGGGGSATSGPAAEVKKQTKTSQGVLAGIGKLAAGIGIVGVIMKALQSIMEPLLEAVNYGVFVVFAEVVALLKALGAGVAAIFSLEFWAKVGDWLMQQAMKIWDFVVEIFNNGLEIIKNVGVWLWENIIQPAFNFLADVGQWIWEQILLPAWNVLADVGKWIWDQILKPAWEFLKDVGLWVWKQILKPAWEYLASVGQWVWDKIIKPGFDYLANIGSLIWEHMKSAFSWTIDIGAKLWDWVKERLKSARSFFGGNSGTATGTRAMGGVVPQDGLYKLHAGESVGRGYTTGTTGTNGGVNITVNVGSAGDKSERFAQQIAQQMMAELRKVQRF